MKVDAIINTTNADMIGYSGVDELVHRRAGPQLDDFCRSLPPLELGFTAVTPGFGLECQYIIHTSGPVWRGGGRGERAILKSCYLESLKAAKELGCHSVAFPLISSGNYGYPKDQVLKYAVQVISEFLQDNEMDVTLCVWDRESYEFSRQLYTDICQFIDSRLTREHTQPVSQYGFDKERWGETSPAEWLDFLDPSDQGDGHQDHAKSQVARSVEPDQSTVMPKEKPAGGWRSLFRNKEKNACSEAEQTKETPEAPWLKDDTGSLPTLPYMAPVPKTEPCRAAESLEDYLNSIDVGFAETLFRYIDERGMTDVECYKKANVDKRTFSKIKSNPAYRPSKQTAVAFAIALKLDLNETKHLLQTAGIALSHSNKFDLIIEYFILKKNYDIYEINEALFEFDQMLLGCG